MKKEHSTHALYSPSGMDRTFVCPGSIQRIAKCPKGKITEASLNGTNAHTLLEFMLREGEEGLIALKLAAAIPFKNSIKYSSEQHQAVRKARAYVLCEYKRLWKKYGIRPTLLIERKVYLDDVVNADCNGTSDIILFVPGKELAVMDYKNGTYAVKAQFNTQMMTYCLGFLEEKGWDFPIIKLVILQPNIPKRAIIEDTWVTSPRAMKDFKTSLILAIKKTKSKDAALVPNQKHCFFCPANEFNKCEAVKKQKSQRVRSKF